MLKPLIPVISDLFSHTFNEMEHISTVHAKYGANHLATELADTGKDNNNKNQDTIKTLSEVPLHIPVSTTSCSFASVVNTKNYVSFTLQNLAEVNISNQAPPPKLC